MNIKHPQIACGIKASQMALTACRKRGMFEEKIKHPFILSDGEIWRDWGHSCGGVTKSEIYSEKGLKWSK